MLFFLLAENFTKRDNKEAETKEEAGWIKYAD
jgi:hypothetical protein